MDLPEFPLDFSQTFMTYYPILTVIVKGAFVPTSYQNFTTNRLTVEIQSKRKDGSNPQVSRTYKVDVNST